MSWGCVCGESARTHIFQDWEREAHVEMFTADGEVMFSQECGIKLHGQDSRNEPQKSFKVYARNCYSGNNTFAASIFEDRDYTEYSSFLLRPSGEDSLKTRMRDSILTGLAAGTGVMYQETEVCVIYINGEYYGQSNIREHINVDSICQFQGWEGQEGSIDLIKGNSQVMQGSDVTYLELLEWVANNDLTTQEAYDVIGSYIDIDNYIAYMSVQIFTGNTDTRNVKRYRNANEDGLWRWCLYDLDWAFVTDTNSIRRWLEPGGMGSGGKTDNTLFIACMENPRFREEFLVYFGGQMATAFTTRNITDQVMERHAVLEPELDMVFERWSDVYSESQYTHEVKKFLNYAEERLLKILTYFKEKYEQMEYYFGDAIREIEEYETGEIN